MAKGRMGFLDLSISYVLRSGLEAEGFKTECNAGLMPLLLMMRTWFKYGTMNLSTDTSAMLLNAESSRNVLGSSLLINFLSSNVNQGSAI